MYKGDIVRLNEEITEKNIEINKNKQELFNLKMEINQSDYDRQLKAEQEVLGYKSKINMLEQEIEDKENEMRRLTIELEHSRYKPQTVISDISEK